MSFTAHLGKDLRILLRNRVLLAALLLYPVLLIAVLGAAFAEPPTRLDVAIANEDAGAIPIQVGSRELSSERFVAEAERFTQVHRVDRATGERLVRAGAVDALIVIPDGFTDAFRGVGSRTHVVVVVDESDPVRAGVARNAVSGALRALLDDVVSYKLALVEENIRVAVEGGQVLGLDLLGLDEAIATLEEIRESDQIQDPHQRRDLDDTIAFLVLVRDFLGTSADLLTGAALPVSVRNEGVVAERLGVLDVVLPGAVILGVFWSGTLATAVLWTHELENRALVRLRAAPHGIAHAAGSKALVALAVVLVQAIVLLGIGATAWGVPVTGYALTLVALVASGVAAVGLGSLAASIARGTSSAALLAVLVLFPMMFLAGLFYPTSYMPAAARVASAMLPMTHAVDALRGGMLRGAGVGDVAVPLVALVLAALVTATAAALLARRNDAWRA